MFMSTLLHVDASANPGDSISRRLTSEFAAAWQAVRPVSAVIHRDLGLNAPSPLDKSVLAALWAKPGDDLGAMARAARSGSEILVEEFLGADAFVMGVPMYNFSVPSGFKAWIDHVVRVGRTVVRGPKGLEPLVKGRRALVISPRAADFSQGGPRDGWDFVEPYLRKVLPYVGLEVDFIPVVNIPGHGDNAGRLEEARRLLREILRKWEAGAKTEKNETEGREAA